MVTEKEFTAWQVLELTDQGESMDDAIEMAREGRGPLPMSEMSRRARRIVRTERSAQVLRRLGWEAEGEFLRRLSRTGF